MSWHFICKLINRLSLRSCLKLSLYSMQIHIPFPKSFINWSFIRFLISNYSAPKSGGVLLSYILFNVLKRLLIWKYSTPKTKPSKKLLIMWLKLSSNLPSTIQNNLCSCNKHSTNQNKANMSSSHSCNSKHSRMNLFSTTFWWWLPSSVSFYPCLRCLVFWVSSILPLCPTLNGSRQKIKALLCFHSLLKNFQLIFSRLHTTS